MRLFHVSEESNIAQFVPRIPVRDDLDKSKGLVWAINEACLPNFFTPRECPRVTYHAAAHTIAADMAQFFSSNSRHCLAIEQAWLKPMLNTTLYLYEFDPAGFVLQDACAGYYVSEKTEVPIRITAIDDLFAALFARNVEVRLVDNLWPLRDAVVASTLNFSICVMRNAQPRIQPN
ncbi:MAG: hypothetical protein FWB76_05185 [Oscillospiraceae bacterium]|nr:hypothetical protein [Oscillospiraceae bacterium]